MSLRRRLFLAFVLCATVACAALGWRMTEDLGMRFNQISEEDLVDTAQILASAVGRASHDGHPDSALLAAMFDDARSHPLHATIYDLDKRTLGINASLTDRHGIVLWDSERPQDIGRDNSQWRDVARTLQGAYGARATRLDPRDPTTSVLHVAAPVLSSGTLIGVLTISKPPGDTAVFMRAAQLQTASICTLCVVLGGLTAALATLWITRPLAALTTWVMQRRGGLRGPPPSGGPSEIRSLSAAFAGLVEEAEGRRYVEIWSQQLAHEMKSPLAALQAATELLQGELAPSDRERLLLHVQTSSERLTGMLERLLVLACAERLQSPARCESIPAVALARAACEALRPLAERRGIAIAIHQDGDSVVQGDRFQLQQAVTNLLQNAVEFSASGSGISIEVRCASPHAQLLIRDRGPGIPAVIRPRLFERFASAARPDGGKGSGLGLVLVREVARIHGGSIALRDRPGGGTDASLLLPLAGTQTPGG